MRSVNGERHPPPRAGGGGGAGSYACLVIDYCAKHDICEHKLDASTASEEGACWTERVVDRERVPLVLLRRGHRRPPTGSSSLADERRASQAHAPRRGRHHALSAHAAQPLPLQAPAAALCAVRASRVSWRLFSRLRARCAPADGALAPGEAPPPPLVFADAAVRVASAGAARNPTRATALSPLLRIQPHPLLL